MKRFSKTWKAEWEGHVIVVTNWWDFRGRSGEALFIDEECVQKVEAQGHSARDLHGEIKRRNRTYRVHVHIGSINLGTKVGCQIFVDNELIGGDIGKKFWT